MVDNYKNKLRHAGWTWLEGKWDRFHSKPRNKDRKFGRNDKRAARQLDRREISDET